MFTFCNNVPAKDTVTTGGSARSMSSSTKKVRRKETDLDRLFRPLLEGVGYKCKAKALVRKCSVDFLFQGIKLAVQVYDDCWHANPAIYGPGKRLLSKVQRDILEKDAKSDAILCAGGYRVEHFWASDLRTRLSECKDRFAKIIGECKMGNHKFGVGLDIGTMNIVSARCPLGGAASFRNIRDAFLDLSLDAKRSLKLSAVNYVERNGSLVVVGDEALTMANLFKREARRPLSKGVVASGEIDAQEILSILIQNSLGAPATEGEHCFYSVPASPLDDPTQDVIYHTEVFRAILGSLGYTPHPTNEAMAIIFSECADSKFSGLSVSFGSGMANVALAYQAMEAMSFSLARGGDFVDQQSAKAVGKTASQMCAIKERGVNLAAPEGRDQQAIALYLKSLISYTLLKIGQQFKTMQNTVDLPEAVPFIISGGTSKASGFMDVFQGEFDKIRGNFPIKISEIRQAKDPLRAVANGLMILALEEHDS